MSVEVGCKLGLNEKKLQEGFLGVVRAAKERNKMTMNYTN